jgi:hypothetical protein
LLTYKWTISYLSPKFSPNIPNTYFISSLNPLEFLLGNLNNSRPCSNGLIIDLDFASHQHNIALSVNARRHDDFEASLNRSDISVDGHCGSDECCVDGSNAVLWKEDIAGCQKGDGVSWFDEARCAEGEGGERLEGELGLVCIGGRAGDDEWDGECVDFIEGEWVVWGVLLVIIWETGVCWRTEWMREWWILERSTDVRAMAGLYSENWAGISEVILVCDAGSSSKVRADSYSFKDRCESDEWSWVRGGEAVGAFCNSGITKSSAEEGDVGSLVVGDLFQVVVEGISETSCHEGGLRIVGETLSVELVLEVLESESVVEDANFKILGEGNLSGQTIYHQ